MNKTNHDLEHYEAPKVQTLDVLSEGVLCASTGKFSINDWENDGESLDF